MFIVQNLIYNKEPYSCVFILLGWESLMNKKSSLCVMFQLVSHQGVSPLIQFTKRLQSKPLFFSGLLL